MKKLPNLYIQRLLRVKCIIQIYIYIYWYIDRNIGRQVDDRDKYKERRSKRELA